MLCRRYCAAAVLFAFGIMLAADLPILNRYAFDERVWLTSYRQSLAISIDAEEVYQGHKSLKVVHTQERGTLYDGVHFTGKAPAEMQVRLNVKGNQKGRVELRLNFNKQGGGNGSAGSVAFPIEYGEKWKTVNFNCSVPADAISAQFVFDFSGPEATIWMNDLYFGLAPDTVSVPLVEKADLSFPLENAMWNPKQRASGFFYQDKLGRSETQVQFAADKSGLYVAFVNQGKAEVFTHPKEAKDGELWADDCNEVFLYNAAEGRGRHFIVNANGALYDALLYQKQDGDPWRDDEKWNAMGVLSTAKQLENSWESRLFIPWKELGIEGKDGDSLGINLGRERKGMITEEISWNSIVGQWNVPSNFGTLSISDGKLNIVRSRKAKKVCYSIERKTPRFAELLEKGVPGGYKVGAWGQGDHKQDFPAAVIEKVGDAGFYRWQNDLLNAWGECGMSSSAFPWSQNYWQGGWDKIEEMYKKYGMKLPYSMHSSYHDRRARELGAKYILPRDPKKVAPIDPVLRKFMIDYIHDFAKGAEYPRMKDRISFVMGMDEPFNGYVEIFSPTINPNKEALSKLDELLKKNYGFGKYGLPDNFQPETADTPFQRIALVRWINDEFLAANIEWKAALKEILPDVPFHAGSNNTCGGMAPMDYSLLNEVSDIIACDPYPTSATYTFGFSRGLYHTGFSTKMLNDLAPSPRTLIMPQCFIYCSGSPEPSDIREWASQALKNGAEQFMWYCGDGAAYNIFDSYVEMLAVNRCINEMDRLKLPESCKSAVFYSSYDQAALKDSYLAGAYSMYGILGEKLKSNFHFIGNTALKKGLRKLSDYKVIYIPKMTWSDQELTASLVEYVKQGGRLVVFDPGFLSWNIDGTTIAERQVLTGVSSIAPRASENEIVMNGKKYPLTPCENVSIPTGYATECYALTVSSSAKVLATYPDGSAAVVVNGLGKGEVVFFGAQPFGNSSLVLEPGIWTEFFAACAAKAGEPLNQAIWDFTIPKEVLKYPALRKIDE